MCDGPFSWIKNTINKKYEIILAYSLPLSLGHFCQYSHPAKLKRVAVILFTLLLLQCHWFSNIVEPSRTRFACAKFKLLFSHQKQIKVCNDKFIKRINSMCMLLSKPLKKHYKIANVALSSSPQLLRCQVVLTKWPFSSFVRNSYLS